MSKIEPDFDDEEQLKRCAERRRNYIEAKTDMHSNLAHALALCELGYSSSGIAKILDVNESTANSYVKKIEDRYDLVLWKEFYILDPEDWEYDMDIPGYNEK